MLCCEMLLCCFVEEVESCWCAAKSAVYYAFWFAAIA